MTSGDECTLEINLHVDELDKHSLAERIILGQAGLIESQLIITENLERLALLNSKTTKPGTSIDTIIEEIMRWPDLIRYDIGEEGDPYLQLLLLPHLLTDGSVTGLTTPLPISMMRSAPYFTFSRADSWAVHPHMLAGGRTCLGNGETSVSIYADNNSVMGMVDFAHTFVGGYNNRSPYQREWMENAAAVNLLLRSLNPDLRKDIAEWDGDMITYNNKVMSLSELFGTDDSMEIGLCIYHASRRRTIDNNLPTIREWLQSSKSACVHCKSPIIRTASSRSLVCARSLLAQKYCTSQYKFHITSHPHMLVSYVGRCAVCDGEKTCYGSLSLPSRLRESEGYCTDHVTLMGNG